MHKFLLRLWVAGLLMALPSALAGAQQTSNDAPNQQDSAATRRAMARRNGMRHFEMLAKQLDLTADQKQKFREIGRNNRQQMLALRQDSSLNDDQKKAKVRELRQQAHKQMMELLTPDQREKLKRLREQHKKEHPGKDASGQSEGNKPESNDEDDLFAGMTSDDDAGPVAK